MPPKLDQHTSPGQKVLSLYSLLMFTGRAFSLTELARELQCSKQTILRMTEQIGRSMGGEVESKLEGGRRIYWITAPRVRPTVSLSPEEIQQLEICRSMVLHLLPEPVREQLRKTIAKTTALLPDMKQRDAAFQPIATAEIKGRIDYDPHQEHLATLIRCIRASRVCEVTYQAPGKPAARTYSVAPSRIISYREALYVAGWRVEDRGTPTPKYPTMLAVHRLHSVIEQCRSFADEPCEQECPAHFGVMNLEELRVRVRFDQQTATYVQERIWSDDQTIEATDDGGIVLEFTARSEPEVISWVLGFGSHAEVLGPHSLREAVRKEATSMAHVYAED